MFRKTMFATLIAAAVLAGSASAQSTGTPTFQSPYRAFVRSELAGLVSFPEPGGTGFEGMYRFGSGRLDVGARAGVWDPIGVAPTSLLAGVEARTRVLTHTPDFPLDGAFIFGAGGNFRSGFSTFVFPVGLTLGRRIDLEDSPVSFSPYVQPTMFLRGGNNVETRVLWGLGIGADVRFSRTFDTRVSIGVGDMQGVSVGAVWLH